MSVLKNIKREKQLYAYNSVHEIEKQSVLKNYKALVEKTGMMIYDNGLISVVAYLKSRIKNNNEFALLYKHIAGWLQKENNIIGFRLGNDEDLLDKQINIENSRQLLSVTKEVISLMDAFKEMVKAESE